MLPPEGTGTEDNPAPANPINDVDEPTANPEHAEDRQMTFDRFSNLRGSLRAGQRNNFTQVS